ncbi:MAG: hypothetical protein LLG04_15310, partial [Parachlamydia sp.]|nr:hypothetical protein [Parachlamydia sp.]
FYLAQLRDPQLQPSLQITPVTISGLTFSGNKVLFGRRSQEVTQYRGLYEAVPSRRNRSPCSARRADRP